MNKFIPPIIATTLVLGLVGCFLPIADKIVVDRGDKVVGAGPISEFNYSCNAGICSYYSQMPFIDASTTIASFANPTGATAVVDLVKLTVSGAATSTYTIACGTSTTAYDGPSIPAATIINSASIATGTATTIINGLSAGTSSTTDTGVARMEVKSTEYLVCKVTSLYTGAFTEVTNTFSGNAWVRWIRTIE